VKWKFDFGSQKWSWQHYLIHGFFNEDGNPQFVAEFTARNPADFLSLNVISSSENSLKKAQEICENHFSNSPESN
jgi:hypothetical protein